MTRNVRQQIIDAIHEVATMNAVTITDLGDDVVLLETGLDSLGFATLVTILEMKLGYDPFLELEAPVYPRTVSEFVEIYERFTHLAK